MAQVVVKSVPADVVAGATPPTAPKDAKPIPKEWGPYEERHIKAETKISAVFRGYSSRKRIRKLYRSEVSLIISDDGPLSPVDAGLGQYAEVHESMPHVKDDRRYEIRDKTAKQALCQLGVNARDLTGGWGFDYQSKARAVLKQARADHNVLPYGVKKQMKWIHYFKDEPREKDVGNYLFGQFDCVAIPVRADYDSNFQEIEDSSKKRGGGGMNCGSYNGGGYNYGYDKIEAPPDCDSKDGFKDWFWVLHAAAPNIGESPQAEDFQAYSKEVDTSATDPKSGSACYKSFRAGRQLDEDMYVRDMAKLWRLTLAHMGSMKVDDAIYFPFGMGAFLRCLGQCDSRYDQAPVMRRLRRRLADELMCAIADTCFSGNKALPASSSQQIQNTNLPKAEKIEKVEKVEKAEKTEKTSDKVSSKVASKESLPEKVKAEKEQPEKVSVKTSSKMPPLKKKRTA